MTTPTSDMPLDARSGTHPDAQPTSPGTALDAQVDARPDVQATSTLSVVEAARVAGVNGRTIRRVIAEGKLAATVEQGAYRVSPAALAAWTSTRAPRTTSDVAQDTGAGIRADAQPDAQDDARAVVRVADVLAAKDETIARLDADVIFLRDQLDQARRDLAEAQRTALVARELDAQRIEARLEALTATVADQRQDAPTAAPGAPGATEAPAEGDPSSWWTRTWRKVVGG